MKVVHFFNQIKCQGKYKQTLTLQTVHSCKKNRSPNRQAPVISKSPLYRTSVTTPLSSQPTPQSPPLSPCESPTNSSSSNNNSSASSSWGEHPFGEHPSRTLFVRNINSNVEETELKELFEVNTLYTKIEKKTTTINDFFL